MEKKTHHSPLITLNLISITGPESTGKSSLAEALANHYKTVWVEEFAREYLAGIGRPYAFDDIVKIAQGQSLRENQKREKASQFLFCDTDILVCKIWSEFRYGKADPWIVKMAEEHRYDLYLLCDIDLPWEEDPLREHPHRRKELFDLYIYQLKRLSLPFQVVKGHGRERLDRAISIIDQSFKEDILLK
jgi:NadR type nicotinamide-nucleotide adenylyltransferase